MFSKLFPLLSCIGNCGEYSEIKNINYLAYLYFLPKYGFLSFKSIKLLNKVLLEKENKLISPSLDNFKRNKRIKNSIIILIYKL